MAWEKHKGALRQIRNTMRDNKAFVYEIATALIKIWKEGEFDEKSNIIDKLEGNPIIEKEFGHNRFKLNSEMQKLFEFLDKNLYHDIDSIRLFLIILFM